VIGVLLLVSMLVSATLAVVQAYFSDSLPGMTRFWPVIHDASSIVLMTGLFAVVFKVLPDVVIRWRDVAVGALITALLMTLGRFLIGLYLVHGGVGSAYGAAGSLVALLVWVYYSSLIVFFGAEFTQVYAHRRGAAIITRRSAHRAPRAERSHARGNG